MMLQHIRSFFVLKLFGLQLGYFHQSVGGNSFYTCFILEFLGPTPVTLRYKGNPE